MEEGQNSPPSWPQTYRYDIESDDIFASAIQWALADLGCQMFSMISVPLYDTHGPEECVYIINHGKIWLPKIGVFVFYPEIY